ncbi:MAG: type III pantothenate kinase [Alistipes sp.]|nr:type III pantothenate kinase [Alistipes sp.]MBQ3247808.1 type III pantothenate kinase [Alistipes sp.]
MNLIVDIGNTATKIAVMDSNNTVVAYRRVEHFTAEMAAALLDEYPSIDKAIVASTGAEDERVWRVLRARVDYFLEFTSTTDVPLKNGYKTPETLGADRLAAAVGAQECYGRSNMLIVDFGTAITYDLVTDGVFRGGNISLGVAARFRALHEYTERLPLCEPTDEKLEFGRSTREAVEQGVMSGIEYETEGYIADFCKKYDNLCIIFTGGDAKNFANRIKNTIFADCNLTLIGLNRILEYNATKQDGE